MKVSSTKWTDEMKAELGELFWMSQFDRPSAGNRYKRMCWAAAEYSKRHPEVSSTAAYKELCRADAWRYV